jgi:hypothetical protein
VNVRRCGFETIVETWCLLEARRQRAQVYETCVADLGIGAELVFGV